MRWEEHVEYTVRMKNEIKISWKTWQVKGKFKCVSALFFKLSNTP